MPWHRDRIHIDSDWGPDGCRRWAFRADGWGAGECRLTSQGVPLGRLDGFADRDHTLEVLTHPTVGWYERTSQGLGQYSIWHDVLAAEACDVDEARFAVFERLGLVEPGAAPHSAIVQRTAHFDVHTPPVRLAD